MVFRARQTFWVDGVEHFRCGKCSNLFVPTDADKIMRRMTCRPCMSDANKARRAARTEDQRENELTLISRRRKANRENCNAAHERAMFIKKAHSIVARAIKSGALVKSPCVVCGEMRVEAHHADYSRPLDVMWLCQPHSGAPVRHLQRCGGHPMIHSFDTKWDAPFDAVSIRFKFTPGFPSTGPSFNDPGEPGEPDDVEVLSVTVTVNGSRHEAPEWLADGFAKLFDDDLIVTAREDIAEARAYRGREAA